MKGTAFSILTCRLIDGESYRISKFLANQEVKIVPELNGLDFDITSQNIFLRKFVFLSGNR